MMSDSGSGTGEGGGGERKSVLTYTTGRLIPYRNGRSMKSWPNSAGVANVENLHNRYRKTTPPCSSSAGSPGLPVGCPFGHLISARMYVCLASAVTR